MSDNTITLTVNGTKFRTLRDILPATPGLRALFVGKVPIPESVAAGHYFQGFHGKMFWNRLREYGLLNPTTPYEDDSLLAHGYGLTDIVKVPRPYKKEPSAAEYAAGVDRILNLVTTHKPEVVVFVYKRVLTRIAEKKWRLKAPVEYGFNPALEACIGARAFAFPLPGTHCTTEQTRPAMKELVAALPQTGGDRRAPRHR